MEIFFVSLLIYNTQSFCPYLFEIKCHAHHLQPIFSFKNRGSYNKIVNLSDKQKSQGIIAASAGNHAQGVALACKKLNISCNIIMPVTAPENKLNSVKIIRSIRIENK